MACSCCGEDREVVALPSRDDVALCRDCVEWLAARLGVMSTPTLPVVDMAEAVTFNERAGFGVRQLFETAGMPGGFGFVDFDGQSVFGMRDFTLNDPSGNRIRIGRSTEE